MQQPGGDESARCAGRVTRKALDAVEIVGILRAAQPGAVLAADPDGPHPSVSVTPESWPEVARFLRDDPRLGMNMLRCISGIDLHPEPFIELVYDLIAMRPPGEGDLWQNAGTLAVRVKLPREGGHVATVSEVWPAAEWHEREAFDLLGVTFDRHPDLRRILCPDDWAGHPLRKDYEFPKEYEGIPAATAESDNVAK